MINPIRAFRLVVLSLPSTERDESGDSVGLARLVIPYIRDLLPRPFSLHLSLISRSPVLFIPFQEPSFGCGYVGWPGIRPATLEHPGYLPGRRSIYVAAHVPV